MVSVCMVECLHVDVYMDPTYQDPIFVGELDSKAETPALLTGNLKMHKKLIAKESRDATATALAKASKNYAIILADQNVTDAEKAMVAAALADFIAAMADAGTPTNIHVCVRVSVRVEVCACVMRIRSLLGMVDEVKKNGGIDSLLDMFEHHPKNLEALRRVLPALRKVAENDSDSAAKIGRVAVKAMSVSLWSHVDLLI